MADKRAFPKRLKIISGFPVHFDRLYIVTNWNTGQRWRMSDIGTDLANVCNTFKLVQSLTLSFTPLELSNFFVQM